MAKSSVFLAISYTKRMKVENAIRKYLESKGFEVTTGRDVTSGGNLCDELMSLVNECDFGVVVYNELRHNISYELGLLDALKKNVVLLKDENIHIDLDEELSDKKGIVFTSFYGEDTEDEIIEQLKENKGLGKALEKNITKRVSTQETKDAKEAAKLLVKSDLALGDISPEKIKELPNSEEIIKSLKKIKNLTAEGHLIKGNAYYSEKKFDEAIEEYTETIELNPKDADAYNNRGNAYSDIKEFDKAIEDYNKAIELNPKYAIAYNNRGVAHSDIKEFDKAIEDHNKAIELNPKYAIAYNNRGVAYRNIKEFDKAIEDYNKAIELNPKLAEAYNNRGVAYRNIKEFDKTIEDYNKVIELNPKYAEAYNNRGVAYSDIKEFDKAIKDFNKAIELNPNDAGTYQNLAEAYIINNNYKDSLAVAQKSLEISKDIKDIIVSKFLIVLSLILQGKGKKEEKELVEFCNQNKGYGLTFEFTTLKNALKDSKYSAKINNLTKLIEENAKRNS